MPQEKCLIIDAEKDEFLETFQHQSLVSSENSNWDNIHFQYTHSHAGKVPEISLKQHIIHIYTDVPSGYVVEHRLDGRFERDIVEAANIIVSPSYIPYWCCDNKDHKGITLSFEPAFLARTAFESVNPDRVELVPHFPNKPDRLIHQIGLALKTVLETDPLGSRFYAQSLTTALSAHLLQHYSAQKYTLKEYTGGLPRYKLRQAIAYIHAHLERELSLEAIASNLGMSSYYFCRLFKQSMGITPYQYLVTCRIDKAKQLLKQQELPLVEVALCCGFANQSSFTQKFRLIVGVTPKVFRDTEK